MQSRWLVALPYWDDRFFHAVACKRAYFLCHIARNNNIKCLFFVVSWGREWLAAIAICKLSIARDDNKDGHVFMSYHNERATRTTLFVSYCKGASNDRDLYTSWGREVHPEDKSQPLQGCKGQLWGYGDDRPPRNNQIFYRLSSARSNKNEHISCRILREATTIMFLMLQSRRTARERTMTISHCKTQGRNNQILHMLLIALMTAMRMSLYRKKRRWG